MGACPAGVTDASLAALHLDSRQPTSH